MAEDYSYLASGIVLIAPYGSQKFDELGNASVFKISPQTDTKTLPDNTNPGGGIFNRIDRVNDWTLEMTFSNLNQENIARFTRGKATDIVAGNVAAEPAWSYKGRYVPLKYPALSINSVEPVGGGTAYVEGSDYFPDRGMLFIPLTSSIPDATTAANIEIDYDHGAIGHVEAAVEPQKLYTIQFHGLNEARSGKRVSSVCHKINGGLLSELSALGDDYVQPSVSQSILKDPTKRTSSDKSEFFYWNQEK